MALEKMNSARDAWHDAFSLGIRPLQYEVLSKGGKSKNDFKICVQVEKGMIQQVVFGLREKDPVAWAFGMIAYTPDGAAPPEAHSTLKDWLRKLIKKNEDLREHVGTIREVQLLALFRLVYQDFAVEDRCGERKRRRYADLAKILHMDAEEYEKRWHKHFVWARKQFQTLPERALPPVASLLWDMKSCALSEDGAAENLRKTLNVNRRFH